MAGHCSTTTTLLLVLLPLLLPSAMSAARLLDESVSDRPNRNRFPEDPKIINAPSPAPVSDPNRIPEDPKIINTPSPAPATRKAPHPPHHRSPKAPRPPHHRIPEAPPPYHTDGQANAPAPATPPAPAVSVKLWLLGKLASVVPVGWAGPPYKGDVPPSGNGKQGH